VLQTVDRADAVIGASAAFDEENKTNSPAIQASAAFTVPPTVPSAAQANPLLQP
jgi:hypothetical protein